MPTPAAPVLFKELFDEGLIQRIQDEFAEATGVASIITQPDGTPITKPSRFTRFCSEIVRRTEKGCRNCFKSDATLGAPHAGGPLVQPCLSGGLWDAGASIIVGGQHVANWLIGQVRDETQTEEAMRAYAREIGVDEMAFLQAFHEVPAMSREQFGRVAKVLHTLANQLSSSAYQNVQQTRSIAQLQRAEELLHASEAKHRHLIQNLHAGVVVHTADTRIVLYNQTALKLLGLSADQILGKVAMDPDWCFLDESGQPLPVEQFPVVQVLTTQRPLVDFVGGLNRPKNLGRSWVLVNAFPEFDERQQLSQIVVTFVDITERKRAIDALRENEARQRAMVANIADVIAIIDANGINRYKSPNLERWFGWRPEEVVGRLTFELVHPEDVPRIQAVFTDLLRDANSTTTAQCRYRCRDGSYKWIELTAVNLVHDPAIQGVLVNYHDITERQRAETLLHASLREKEALLKEVHHRVKNNLQVVTSLLRLEAGRSAEPGTKAVLREMQSRIRTMAVLHETLYRSGNFSAVDLSGYLQQLTTHLFRAHNTEPGRVRLVLALNPIHVELDQAIPCGLLVNELVTNSLKHAFPPPSSGEVRISLERDERGQVRLEVSDTGVGLPENFDLARASTLGLQLVSDLARQLRGTLEIFAPGRGAGFTLTFAADPASPADAKDR